MTVDSKERFSSRAAAYVAGRPSYPDAIVRHLETIGALTRDACVVDVGAGTGLSAEPFLRAGYRVIGIEPNAPMRTAGCEHLAQYTQYDGRDGSAESTGLADASADLIVAGQAFHWFDAKKFRAEAQRILRPGRYAALFWNDRATTTSFGRDYEALLVELGRDYAAIRRRHEADDSVPVFFGGRAPAVVTFAHERTMRWDDVAALAASASYLPGPHDRAHAELMTRLRAIFDRHAQGDAIVMPYTTRLYAARLA